MEYGSRMRVNSLRKILIVDDIDLNRRILENILRGEYEIYTARDGKEAIEKADAMRNELSAILLDIVMPVMDGYDVLRHMRKDSELSQIPVIVTTGSTDGDAEIKALTLGANDFVAKPYVTDIIKRRLQNTISLRENAAMVNALQRDALTGTYTREAFIKIAGEMIREREPGYYVIACFDINNFKVINDQYGTAKGDFVLRYVAQVFAKGFGATGGIVSRVMADNFAVLYPASFMNSAELSSMRASAGNPDPAIPKISFSIGRYLISDLSLSVSSMYDRASLAKDSIKGRYDIETIMYDESMREQLLREQEIIDEMIRGLTNNEYEVWLQPQYNHSNGAMIGAEALVRWRHPEKGMVAPGVFIPVFERNGFIYELDKYVWEKTCALLRKWMDEGRAPIPISVNISRHDIFHDDLVTFITGLIGKYGIPVDMLRLEVTESAFAKSTNQIISVVRQLIDYGFTVEIDDFGSGYSSLNTLKDVPAQIVKLDMRFLDDKNTDRGGNILESVVRMAKWLGMSVVAEGVETREQADYLCSIGCNYIQGYLYSRPVHPDLFERLSASAVLENSTATLETVENLDNNSFWRPDSIDTLIFNSYVGGACIFEYYKEKVELLRVTRKYVQLFGNADMTVEDVLKLDLSAHMDAEGKEKLRRGIAKSIETRDEVTDEYIFHGLKGCPEKTYLRSTIRVIAVAGERRLVYCTNENITEQRELETRESTLAAQMRAIMANIAGGITATSLENGEQRIIFANEQYYAMLGYTKEQFEAEIGSIFDTVHPEDLALMRRGAVLEGGEDGTESFNLRMTRRDKTVMHARVRVSTIYLPGISEAVKLAVISDVTDVIEAARKERLATEKLTAVMDNVRSGITATVFDGGSIEYLFANDTYYEIHGYTREQFLTEKPDCFRLMLESDRARVLETLTDVNRVGKAATLEYRTAKRDGTEIWVRMVVSTRTFENVEGPVQFSVIRDITAEKRADEKLRDSDDKLRFLNDTASDLLGQTDVLAGIDAVLQKTREYFGAARAFIYEYRYAEGVCASTYEIYAPDVEPYTVKNTVLPIEATAVWQDTYSKSDFLRYVRKETSVPEDSEYLKQFTKRDIGSILAVALRSGGALLGTMGVDEPTRHLEDYANLKALGDYMAVILTRRDLSARIENDRQALANMMNDMPGGFVRLRVKGDGSVSTEYVNESFSRLRGMSAGEILDADGADAMSTIHPDDLDAVKATIAEITRTGSVANMHYRLKHGDTYIPVNVFGRVTRGEKGEAYINAYYTDLSASEKRDMLARETVPYLLSAIMSSSKDLTFAKDKDFKYICCSPVFARFAGKASQEEVIGRTDYELFAPEAAKQFRGDDERLFSAGEALAGYIEPIPSSDGIQHYCETSKYIIKDSTGEILGMYGIGRDITNERTTFSQLMLLTNSIPGGIASYICSPSGMRITYFNDGFCNMLGYTREEYGKISESGAINVVFDEDVPALKAAIADMLSTGRQLDAVYRVHVKNGDYKWVNLKGAVSERYGELCTINTVLFDVTETQRAQEEQRLHTEEMRLAMSQLGKMVCEYNPNTHRLTVPENYAKLYGLDAVIENVPESIISSGIITEDTLNAYIGFYEAILRGEESGGAEYCERRSDGTLNWQRDKFSTLFDTQGNPVMTVISVENTTEEHRRYELEASRPSLGEANLIVHALFNLTTGETLDYAYANGEEVPVGHRTAFTYGKSPLENLLIDELERAEYRVLNDPKALLERFGSGETELSFDYRRRLPDGDIIWARNILRMVREPGGSDILLFEYCYNIEREKTLELMYHSLVSNSYDYVAKINGRTRRFEIIANTGVRYCMPSESGENVDAEFGRLADSYIHPDDRQTALEHATVESIKRSLDSQERVQYTYRVIRPGGEVRYKRMTQYYLDKARDIIIATREDITEAVGTEMRRSAELEKALLAAGEESRVKEREAAERFKLIIDNVNGGTSVATLVGGKLTYLYVNDEYYSMLGYTKEQFERELENGIFDLIAPEDVENVKRVAKMSETVGKVHVEFRARKRNGDMIWVRSVSSTCAMPGIDAPAHVAVMIDMTSEKAAEDSLRISEEQFRIAASIGERVISRYDIKTETFYHNDSTLLALGFPPVVKNVPRAFVKAGNVREDFITRYFEFYDRIRHGESPCSFDVMLKVADGSFRWHHHEATVISDIDGKPSQAILVLTDIDDQLEKEALYKKWQQSLSIRREEDFTLLRYNLSRNAGISSVEGSLLDFKAPSESAAFDALSKEYADAMVHADDRERYMELINSDSLIAGCRSGSRMSTLEYRELRSGGFRWLKLTVELVEYPNSADIEAFLMYENIDDVKREELRNRELAMTDPLTGSLNRSAFTSAVCGMISDPETENFALMMLDIDGFKLINDTYGHARGDQVLIQITESIKRVLRKCDLLSRFGGDEYMICLKNTPDDGAVAKIAERICELLRELPDLKDNHSASIGIAVYPRDAEEFGALYRKSDMALYAVKAKGKNGYAFCKES